ncbi:unnamed protein product [Adineta steineri]|uniref:F-box domain-containing protein n=1 Tax=Adineta steineri TaxID=433720 RepID=A0A814I601_9BILA|nr:unnamed protein product [Adineta steineri]
MYFESLANELLLDIFEFFDGIDLFRSFYGLNTRFNNLLSTHFHPYRFDFRSISKHNFNFICHHCLPLIIERIISLKLSNDDETPNLPNFLFSYGFTLDKFIRLQSLSLYSISSFKELNDIIVRCDQLPYLTHLYLIDGANDGEKKDTQLLFNNIWHLKKLHHLSINYILLGKLCLSRISVESLSIQYLYIENISCDLKNLLHLFKYTPNLRYLNTAIHYNVADEQIPIQICSITSLKLTFESSVPVMIKLFQMMPNLYSLTLKTMDIYLSGNKWKKILLNYLTKLQIFRLRMYFEFPHEKNINEQFEKLINTYRSSFWIKKHQWFVQCDSIPFGTYNHGILYTLPYAFNSFICYDTLISKYTCPDEKTYWRYKNVNSLQYMKYKINPTDYLNNLPIQFPNIQHLKIGFPFDEQFYSFIPSLNQLKSLEIVLGENYIYQQLQTLINLSPCLYSLRLFYSFDSKISVKQITSSSIRRLSFITKCSMTLAYFNNDECTDLAYSQLGQRCEVLVIKIENRNNVLILINIMKNLRSLVVQCKVDTWDKRNTSLNEDELVEWLRLSLPSTYSICRDTNETSYIRIWIGENINNTFLSH